MAVSMLSVSVSSIPKKSTRNKSISDYFLPGEAIVDEHASWGSCTTLGAGLGEFTLVKLLNCADAERYVPALRADGYQLIPLGGGSNFAGSDMPLLNTVFLKVEDGVFHFLQEEADGVIHAGAACTLRSLLTFAKEKGRCGISGLSGIPGSCGGALFMNAGAKGVCISDFLISMDVMDLQTGKIRVIRKEELPWQYRSSGLGSDLMILAARFRFPDGDVAEEDRLWSEESERRRNAPRGRSAGSTFRNPPGMIAGKLLESAGIKGRKTGAFEVAMEHGNWVVNRSGAAGSSADYASLLHEMRETVLKTEQILLHTEVRFANMQDQENAALKVLVLKGGVSSEREISLRSGGNVADALRTAGFTVKEFDIQELALTDDMLHWADVIFPVLHGGYGEDGRLQELLEKASLKFVGPGSASCRLIMDKKASKQVMFDAGLNTAKYCELREPRENIPAGFEFPLVVKPNSNGSTFGVTFVEDMTQWREALAEAFRYDESVLVEEYIQGVEGAVGVVAGKALPAMEVQYPGKIYDYDAKYNEDSGCRHFCPPVSISEEIQAQVADAALRFAAAAGADQLVRIDFIVRNSDKKVYLLEGNGLPGMTNTSMLPEEARTAGISMPELCTLLVRGALCENKLK